MGWLGWTADVALATDVNLVRMGIESRQGLLQMIFGDGSSPPSNSTKGSNKKPTAQDFRKWARRHNVYRARKAKEAEK